MTTLTLLFVAIALGTDAFSMAIGIGCAGRIKGEKIFLVAGVVAIFHVFMPLIGMYLGALLGQAVGELAAMIGALVLGVIGIHMIREGLKGEDGELIPSGLGGGGGASCAVSQQPLVVTSLWALIVLAASVSLDALTVGFGLGTVAANIPVTVLTLGVVAGLMTAAGLTFGRYVGNWLGEKAVIVGGVILLAIAIHMAFF